MDHVNLKLPITEPIDVDKAEEAIKADPDIAVVYCCHHETGTGILNPIREIGAVAHKYGKVMVVDTTSTYAMIPIDMDKDNLDFIMASAQNYTKVLTNWDSRRLSHVNSSRNWLSQFFIRMIRTGILPEFTIIYMKEDSRFIQEKFPTCRHSVCVPWGSSYLRTLRTSSNAWKLV